MDTQNELNVRISDTEIFFNCKNYDKEFIVELGKIILNILPGNRPLKPQDVLNAIRNFLSSSDNINADKTGPEIIDEKKLAKSDKTQSIRKIAREQAKKEIKELYELHAGEIIGYSDIIKELNLDLELVVELCAELELEGEIVFENAKELNKTGNKPYADLPKFTPASDKTDSAIKRPKRPYTDLSSLTPEQRKEHKKKLESERQKKYNNNHKTSETHRNPAKFKDKRDEIIFDIKSGLGLDECQKRYGMSKNTYFNYKKIALKSQSNPKEPNQPNRSKNIGSNNRPMSDKERAEWLRSKSI